MRLPQHKGQRLKGVFTPFCKGLGIYCNGFWGCGGLGLHKCNLSGLSHSIKEVEIVKKRTSIHGIIDTSMLHLLSYISYRKAYWSRKRERERFGYFVRRGAEEKRREERETTKKVCSRNFVISFAEYNKDKVLVDVATSLVVNHLNIGALCLFVLYLFLCLW